MLKKMRVLIINDYAYVNGGAGQVALSSAVALAEHGVQVTLFSAVGPVSPELNHENLTVICTNQFDILNDPNRLRAIGQGLWNLKAARMLADVLRDMDPIHTIIHIHSWTKALSSSITRLVINKGFKVICTLHDYFTVCPNGGFFDYQRNEICCERPLSSGCWHRNCDSRNIAQKQWRMLRQYVQNFGYIPTGIKHFISISEFSLNILKLYQARDARIYMLSNPIDIEKNKPVQVDRNKLYVAVGRISKEKGPQLFAEAARQVGCFAIFIGDGEYTPEIQKNYPEVEITGWLNRETVVTKLYEAHVLVFPSLLYETQGMVVAEAAAMGIPAIVPDTCAARDMVINGETGLWFKGGDIEDLQRKMKIFLNPEIAGKMGKAAYENYWKNPFTMERHVEGLLSIYEQVLQQKE